MTAPTYLPPSKFIVDISGTQYDNRTRVIERIVTIASLENFENTAEITLADSDGKRGNPAQVPFPEPGTVSVALGWEDLTPVVVFMGYIESVASVGDRHRGRQLLVSCRGSNPTGDMKTTQDDHIDDATFGDAAKKFFGNAGMTANIDQKLASIKRPYWSIGNENVTQWATRMSKELGGFLSVQDTTAAIVPVSSDGTSASGQQIAQIEADVGINLIRWHLTPLYSYVATKQRRANTYNPAPASWLTAISQGSSGSGSTGGDVKNRFKIADKDQAQHVADSDQGYGDLFKSGGYVTIIGEPNAKCNGKIKVVGTRPEVDNTYRIMQVTHILSRVSGFETEIECRDDPSSGESGGSETSGA